jgi:hypothetical protein
MTAIPRPPVVLSLFPQLMSFFDRGFEMGFEKTERIDPRAAALAKRRSLSGFSNRDFLEHCCNQHPHGWLLLRVLMFTGDSNEGGQRPQIVQEMPLSA